MREALFAATLILLVSVATSTYAADVDGAWSITGMPDPKAQAYAMTKESNGRLLLVWEDNYGGTMGAWMPLIGPFDGTTGNLHLLSTSQANGNLPQAVTCTFTLTSPTTATLTVISCTNFPQQDNCPPPGSPALTLTKLF